MGIAISKFTLNDYERFQTNMLDRPLLGTIKVSSEQWNEWTGDILNYSEIDVVVDCEGIVLCGRERNVYLEISPSKAKLLIANEFTGYMTINKLQRLGFTLPVYESRISDEAMKDTEVMEDTHEDD